jgi:hypothetical protein
MVQLRADQARWLEDQAHEARMSEAAVVRHLIEAAMMDAAYHEEMMEVQG